MRGCAPVRAGGLDGELSSTMSVDIRGVALGFDLPPRYEAKKQVGKGAFGVLISAHDREEGVQVAIKKVQLGGAMGWDRHEAKSLIRELKLLQHFDHENIMRLRDLLVPSGGTPRITGESSADGAPPFSEIYMVQDLMATDLHYIIQSAARGKQRMTEDHIQYFTYQLLRGLKAIHSAKVLHRDLKPSNLLVNKDCELRICDFGLARGVDFDPAQCAQLTEYVVTRWYRAPELLTGNEKYGPAIDMWSVGCILAEMLSALQPGNVGDKAALFPGNDVLASLKLIIATLGAPSDLSFIHNAKAVQYIQALSRSMPAPAPLAARYPDAPPAAIDLLQRLLEFEPSRRPSADEALNHPLLSSLHGLNAEPLAHTFDFAFEAVSDSELRDIMNEEVKRFHPEVPSTPSPHALHAPPSAPPTPGSALAQSSPEASSSELTSETATTNPFENKRVNNKRGHEKIAASPK